MSGRGNSDQRVKETEKKEMDVEFLLQCHNYDGRPGRAALDTVHRILKVKTDQLSISSWVSSSFARCWASIIRLWHTAKITVRINLLQAYRNTNILVLAAETLTM